MNAGFRSGRWPCWLRRMAVSASLFPNLAYAQSSSETRLVVPTIQVGVSSYSAEFKDDDASDIGLTFKAGVRTPYLEIAGLFERWDHINESRYSSALLEASYYFAGQGRLAPFLVLAAGHTWRRYNGEYPSELRDEGAAAGVGLGMRLEAVLGTEVRVEGVLRTDVGGYSGLARLLAGWAPELRDPLPDALALYGDASLTWMLPLSGPWRFVEPGFGFHLGRSSGTWGGTLGLAVFHWEIPGNVYPGVPGLSRTYIWDTRAFVATPGLVWRSQRTSPIELRAGPSIVIMGEGPDNGANFGGHFAAALTPLRSLPVTVGMGWFWMQSGNQGDSRFTNSDQHGLTLHAALAF